MGKKVSMSRASAKIAKKQQAVTSCSPNSLTMKALRPRVYITDVDNFKRLVQELTGNSSIPSTQPVPTNAPLPCPPQLPYAAATVIENGSTVSRVEETLMWDDFEGVLQQEDTLSKYFPGELLGLESSWHLQQIQTYEQQLDTDALLTSEDIESLLSDVNFLPLWDTHVAPDASLCDFIAGGIF